MATEREFELVHSGISMPNEREGVKQKLAKLTAEGYTIVSATFSPGSVFDALLSRPKAAEPAKGTSK